MLKASSLIFKLNQQSKMISDFDSANKHDFDKVIEVYEDREKSLRHIHVNYGNDIEKAITSIQKTIKKEYNYV